MSENQPSIFEKKSLKEIYTEIQSVYLSDERPWVIGYSGGKDSSTILQLIWYSISELPEDKRKKHIYVISSDTLVESPILLKRVREMHKLINETAKQNKLPFSAQKVQPIVNDTFWVNLLGKGYPAPQKTFRWCTERLKIKPADRFIMKKVSEFGEVVLILGVRKAESNTRAQLMNTYKIKGSLLSRHSQYPQTYVYTPIENFTVDDVWNYLLQKKCPWGANNRDLLALYTDKNAGECPLVVDKSTPSCGGSRFGCWTCTVVTEDKAMKNLIREGQTWMKPLSDIREFLFKTTNPEIKKKVRQLRSRKGQYRFKSNGNWDLSYGPYLIEFRKELLRKILEAQKQIDLEAPENNFQIVLPEELHEIRRIWMNEEGDWEDSVPKIYHEIMGKNLDWLSEDTGGFSDLEVNLLNKICAKHAVPQLLVTKLLDVEKQIQGMTRRASASIRIESVLKQDWRSEDEIIALAKLKSQNKE